MSTNIKKLQTTASKKVQLLQVAQAALLAPPFSVLSYLLPSGFTPDFWKPGLRLAVPLGRTIRPAVLLSLEEIDPENFSYVHKELSWPLEHEPLLSAEYLEFALQFSLRQAKPVGRILAGMLPAGLRNTTFNLRFFDGREQQDFKLSELGKLSQEVRSSLARLWMEGQGRILKIRESADEELYSLKQDPPWAVRPSAHKQLQLLEFLAEKGQASRRLINRELGADFSEVLKTLLVRGLLEMRLESIPEHNGKPFEPKIWQERYQNILETPAPFDLNIEQKTALQDLVTLAEAKQGVPRLLYGVTGSGKTAVYLELAARVLRSGRSVMLMAPEVALAVKLKINAEERFPGLPVYLVHGYQSPGTRESLFIELARTRVPCLVIGTRSALFLQLQNLGAIILDEEHDSSFKQDERLNYQAKELAWYRMQKQGAVLVLGSATPDLKTYYAAESGQLKVHHLAKRVGGGTLPEITLVKMPGVAGSEGILTAESSTALAECIQQGEQAVILLNRRGYAPSMLCLSCGVVFRCPNCDISLSYHKSREKMICHYCGYSVPFPSPCPACKNLHFLPMGEGTEKLEERLQGILPTGTRILRLDRDSTSRPEALEDILQAFGRGEAEVLVGTQMLSKGHHFPRVTLAIVADADLGLNMPDYNAAERTFQLLLQAAGRAGRGNRPGRVIVQTRDLGHYCWEYLLNNDYEGFYRKELLKREQRRYPPFVRLALVRFSFPLGWPEGHTLLNSLGECLQAGGKALGVSVLGPAPAPHPLREKRLRFQCLLKGQDWQAIRGVFTRADALVPAASPLRISLDLDPVSML